MEDVDVQLGEAAAQHGPEADPEHGAEQDEDGNQLKEVKPDVEVGISHRLERGDLRPLEAHQAREHHVHQEGGYAEEDERDHRGPGAELAHLLEHDVVRGLTCLRPPP